uniref:COP1-interactive protein 1-like n=1 Tax=Cicer arietinum TaxID=3827 RepID=A0A3Q7Y4F0_CICAR
ICEYLSIHQDQGKYNITRFIGDSRADIENNLSRVLKLIKTEDQSKKENSNKETELVGLIEDFYNQYQSLYVLYGRLTGEYMKVASRRVKVSSLSSSSSDSEYFSSDETDFNISNKNPFSRISQREHYSSFVNTLEALKTQKSTEPNEFETHEVKQLRSKNAELEQEAKCLRNHKCKIEEKMKHFRNEALNQKKEYTDQINVMQQNLESVCNKNRELEIQLENERGKVSQYLIRIQNMENLAETVSAEESLLKEKLCLIERIKELESQCSKQNDLEEQLRNARCEINTMQKQKSELELQNERSQNEYSETIQKLAETIDQKMEDNVRVLHQRIDVVEQLNKENKESFKLTKQKYEEEVKMLGETMADYEHEIRRFKEKVWKLEADVSKEGGEKMNLMKTVTQFERKIGKLEKKVKEKDEELVSLGEKKREAIRQLCFLVEFHRDRCLYLRDLMLKMNVRNI